MASPEGGSADARRPHLRRFLSPRVVAALVGLCTTAVAAVGSWSVSLWSDEVATISAAERSPQDLWRLLGHIDAVHGTYYAAMHMWIEGFGTSPFSIRVPSAIAVGFAAAGVYLLARHLDVRSALWAAALFAVLPRITWAGIEGRSFAPSIAVAVWLTLVLHSAVARRSRGRFMVYAVLLAFGTAVNLYVVLLAVAHAVTLLVLPGARRSLPAFVAATVSGLVLVSPLLRVVLRQGGQLGQREHSVVAMARNIVVNQWFLGETPTGTATSGATLDDSGVLWKFAAVTLALVCWTLVVRALVMASGRDPEHAQLLAWTVPWLVLPTVLVVLGSLVSPTFYNARYLGFSAPAVAILVAAGARSLPPRPRAAAVVLILLLVAPVYQSQRIASAKSGADWSAVVALLDGRTAPGDGVYFGPRDDPREGRVLRSLRTLSLGYPEPFEGLRDVTLLADPAQGATLFGTSAPLADRLDQLEGVDTLWVLRRQDRPADARTEDSLLREAGFTVVEEWDYPQTEVLELTRG